MTPKQLFFRAHREAPLLALRQAIERLLQHGCRVMNSAHQYQEGSLLLFEVLLSTPRGWTVRVAGKHSLEHEFAGSLCVTWARLRVRLDCGGRGRWRYDEPRIYRQTRGVYRVWISCRF